jgi:hypothetical protein
MDDDDMNDMQAPKCTKHQMAILEADNQTGDEEDDTIEDLHQAMDAANKFLANE